MLAVVSLAHFYAKENPSNNALGFPINQKFNHQSKSILTTLYYI